MNYINIDGISDASITASDFAKYCTSTSTNYTNYCNCYREERTNKMKYFDNETMKIWKLLNPDYIVSIDFSATATGMDGITEEYTIVMMKGMTKMRRCISSTQLNWSKGNNMYISLECLNDMKREFDKKPVGMSSGRFNIGDFSSYSFTFDYVKKRNEYEIKKIVYNPSKNATTVIFEDGSVEVVKKSPDDSDADIFSVVAYAVAKHIYGSNSAFKREVCKDLDFIDKEFDKVIKTASLEELTEAMKSIVKIIKKKNEEDKK